MAKITKKTKKISQKLKTVSSKPLPTRVGRGKTGKVIRKAVVKKRKKPSPKIPIAMPIQSMEAEQAKYFTHRETQRAAAPRTLEAPVSRIQRFDGERSRRIDLPAQYDKDLIVLQVRDPWWVHTYWQVRDATYQKLKDEFKSLFDSAKKTLRVYDVSYINFNGSNAHRFFDIEVTRDANNWYIDTGGPGRSWCVDLGLTLADGRFITIVRSNVVNTPLEGPSWITDEEWMVPDELFAKLYTTAIGLGGSPVKLKKPWVELQKRQLASGGISSVGFSPVKRQERKFWLVVNTELIVYGATEPTALVAVGGRPIALRSDGTFSLRFSLPDGKQVIPVKAKSSDGIDERTITPVVTKETK